MGDKDGASVGFADDGITLGDAVCTDIVGLADGTGDGDCVGVPLG